MPLKFIEVSQEGTVIKLNRGHLVLKKEENEKRIPLDLISIILFTGYGQLVSTRAIEELIKRKCMIVFCDSKFMPFSYLFPKNLHHEYHKRVQAQIKMSEPQKKRFWKYVIAQKVRNQGRVLKLMKGSDSGLFSMAANVSIGDKGNIEAKAARLYWRDLMEEGFLRSDESHYFNNYLNYAYTILRSLTARQLVLSGLNPMFGIHHSNQNNSYCLVDDLMEPFRPIVDIFLIKCAFEDSELSPVYKMKIAKLTEFKVEFEGKLCVFTELISTFINSYVNCLMEGDTKQLKKFPNYKIAV